MKKHWKLLSALTLATLLATACGSNEVEKKVGGSDQTGYETPSENTDKETVSEDLVSTDIQFSDGYYTFTLKNETDKDLELTFSSSQEYEYHIKDSQGNIIYTYSMDKMFMQQIVEKTLAPGETYTMNVDVDILSSLQAETYTLEIWSMADKAQDVKTEIEFTLEEVATSLEGTYVGQIDNNSVEIKDSNGNPKAYRLTGITNEFISSLEAEDTVIYSYYKKNGQLFLTMIHGELQ
ncbi:BsuPI-related putative proteinase inhibitor [Anaerobacillus alkaliphilus]|nr:BsuPI-related putative proteinase inhibitor [Anaerobacillus alkaliphilus]